MDAPPHKWEAANSSVYWWAHPSKRYVSRRLYLSSMSMMLSSLLSRNWKKRDSSSSVPQHRNFISELTHGLKILTTVDRDPKPCVQRCDLIELIYEDSYDFDIERACIGTYGRHHQIKLFPPPISMLARTEQMRSYMPWTLIKSSDGQGRVVMKEVRVKHHDYFKATREDGRRTLRLMSVDDEKDSDKDGKKVIENELGEDEEEDDHTTGFPDL